MNRVFIFDMDGVLVNSEPVWERYESVFLPQLLGKELFAKIRDQILGNSVNGIYKVATQFGLQVDKVEFERTYDRYAEIVYSEAETTAGIESLLSQLASLGFMIGLVSSSRQYWIDLVVKKNQWGNIFQCMLSLDGNNKKPKPSPDGFLEAINALDSIPSLTIILEDSKRGVEAARSSGALTICLLQHLSDDYFPKGADIYIKTADELNRLLTLISPTDEINMSAAFRLENQGSG